MENIQDEAPGEKKGAGDAALVHVHAALDERGGGR